MPLSLRLPTASRGFYEHYLRCSIVLNMVVRRLGMHMSSKDSFVVLLLAARPPVGITLEVWLTRCALLVYAVYRITSAARRTATLTPEESRALNEAV